MRIQILPNPVTTPCTAGKPLPSPPPPSTQQQRPHVSAGQCLVKAETQSHSRQHRDRGRRSGGFGCSLEVTSGGRIRQNLPLDLGRKTWDQMVPVPMEHKGELFRGQSDVLRVGETSGYWWGVPTPPPWDSPPLGDPNTRVGAAAPVPCPPAVISCLLPFTAAAAFLSGFFFFFNVCDTCLVRSA